MLAIERRNLILEALQKDGRVVVGELSQQYEVSEETIRRDLDRLEKEGYAIKTYGGAVINENNNVELPFMIRKNANIAAKQKIAELLAEQIHDGAHIMLDASSTAVFVARNIKNRKNITLITNSLEILVELADVSGWRIMSTGGALREGSLALVGPQAEKMLSGFYADMAVISCKGIDAKKGFTESNELHAQTKKVMLESASQKILVIDSTKFDKISFTKIGSLSDLTMVVTEKEPEERWKQIFASAGVECVYPGKN